MTVLFLFCAICGGMACAAGAFLAGYGGWGVFGAYSLGGIVTLVLTALLVAALSRGPSVRPARD